MPAAELRALLAACRAAPAPAASPPAVAVYARPPATASAEAAAGVHLRAMPEDAAAAAQDLFGGAGAPLAGPFHCDPSREVEARGVGIPV